MSYEELSATIELLSEPGRGILAADESISTIAKRFKAIGIENTEEHRKNYRLMLATAPDLASYINGVILFEETLDHADASGKTIPQLLLEQGILPGIKVDKGLIPMLHSNHEQLTQGLDGLAERVKQYKAKGARFAKWRNVYSISEDSPSFAHLRVSADLLAQYAAICQNEGIVPIVEPEILMEGDHSIEVAADVAAMVLHEVFSALYVHQVELDFMVLKPSMVTSGQAHQPFSAPEDVADFTIDVFRHHVPAAVPTINFLSGGQSSAQATLNLQTMNAQGPHPWNLSFSYGRALQDDCLKVWGGKPENVAAAQQALLHRARLNSLASLGEYRPEMEK